MSEYKPMVPISLNTAWNVADILVWMSATPMMDKAQREPMLAMSDEIMHGVQELYKEREEKSLYFKALADDMPDDIVAMIEHEYGVRDLLDLNEKQLGESFWYAVQSGLLKEMGVDKLVCLEKRPGKEPRVRLVGTDDESILKVSGPNYSFKAFKTRDGVDVCRVMREDGQNVEFENDAGTILYTNLTEQQVQELLNGWGNQQ